MKKRKIVEECSVLFPCNYFDGYRLITVALSVALFSRQ